MKQLFLSLLFFFLFTSTTQAQSLPLSAEFHFEVINISKENGDAQTLGAQPGDVLRYDVNIVSDTEDVIDFVPTIDVTEILRAAELVDAGIGTLNGDELVYPALTKRAPCDQTYSFFVRVSPDCGGMNGIDAASNGERISVPLNCELMMTGPGSEGVTLFIAILGVFGGIIFFVARKFRRPQ